MQYRGASTTLGLYFVGLPFLHSFASMLIGGAGKDAGRVVRHIVTERAVAQEARLERRPLAASSEGMAA